MFRYKMASFKLIARKKRFYISQIVLIDHFDAYPVVFGDALDNLQTAIKV